MGRKILLIDDSAMLRRIATNILHGQPARHDVATAARAAEGFALACVGRVDLILLDYLLAGLDDAPLCRRLQADSRTAKAPVILLVGPGVPAPAWDALPANVVETLAKPFAPEQLTAVVNAVIGFEKTGASLREMRASLHPELSAADAVPVVAPALNGHSQAEPGTDAVQPAEARHGLTDSWDASTAVSTEDARVVLKGTTAITSLNSVLHAVEDGGYSGALKVWPPEGEPTEILFDQGRIMAVSTRDADTYANRAADVLPVKVSPATLEEAVAAQKATGVPFLLNLGVRGLLSKSAAVGLLHRFGQRQFARLWPQRVKGAERFEFRALTTLPQYTLRLEPSPSPLEMWLLETTRMVRAEDVAGNLRHEGTVGTPFFQADGEATARRLNLAEDERAFLRLISGRADLPTIAKALGISPEAAYLTLFRFRCLDVLSYRTAPAAFVVTPRTHLRRVLPLAR